MKKIFFFLLAALNSYSILAQLAVDNSTLTPQQLAQNVLLGQGITISNIKFNNSTISANTINDQIGQFSNGTTTNIGIDKGIILSTGNAIIAAGPNDQIQATLPTSNSVIGDNDLFILSNNQTIRSVAILEFDFVPTGNKLNFNFVFASEEYPEYANETYNDNFGFFLSGPGINGPFSGNAENIALIPTTSLPVSINNLNNGVANAGPCENCQYYVNNASGTTIQYDGFTQVIGATADVQCGQTYHMKLAIANVGDDNFDSAVFIEGASFSATGIDLGDDLTVCSATNYILKTGLDSTVVHEWTFNGTIIPFEVGSEITVNQSGTYGVKAIPIGISCPVSDEIKVDFNSVQKPDVSCGTKTTNSIQFNWLSIPNISEYSVSYKIGLNPEVPIGSVGNVNSYTVSGVTSGETVVLKVTPIGGNPANCFEANSISCTLDNCLNSPNIILSQGNITQQICEKSAITDIIYTIGGGATNASITSGSLPVGITTSLVGNQFTISGTATAAGNLSYTISTSGGCGANASASGSITVSNSPTIILNQGNSTQQICENSAITDIIYTIGGGATSASITSGALPAGITTSLVGNQFTISGTATAAGNFSYTISTSGGCGTNASASGSITVIQKATPTFNAVNPICEGETIAALPMTSDDFFSGTWSPVLDNLNTTEYTFTPNTGQCANSTKLTITVNSKKIPQFTAVAPICIGETIAALPTTSDDFFSGTWSPVLDNLNTTEYTFTPNTGQCANSTKLTITVNSKKIPQFTAVAPICEGETIAVLPTTSDDLFSGTWSPVLDNLNTTEYTFTPNTGQCANSTKLTITVNSKKTPQFTAVAPICEGETIAALPMTSDDFFSGTWSPVLDNLNSTEYTFTPNTGQCANQAKLTITVNPKPIPLLVDGIICKDKITNATIQSFTLDTKLNSANYIFEWFLDGNPIIGAVGNTLEADEKGIYSVIATHKTTNCHSDPIQATITETLSNETVVKIEQINSFNDTATITISIVKGTGNYEFQLDNGLFQTSPVFSNVAAGTHKINIIDTNSCYKESQEIIVLGYPQFFTPNGDGNNDTWNIIGLNSQLNTIISIFDRYGKLLKQLSPNSKGWDGTYNGHPLLTTDYWFKVEFFEDGIPKVFRSHFTLKR